MEKFELAKKLFYEGLAYLNDEKYEQAEVTLYECLKLVPDRVSTLTNLSAALIKLKKIDAARELALKAVSLDAGSAQCWINLGLIEKEESNASEAVKCFEKAIEVDPNCAEAWSNKGIVLTELERNDEALASHERALRLKPGYAEAFSNRGITLRALNRLDEALASYQQAIELKPDYASAHNNRGLLLHQLMRLDEALASYDAAIKFKPDYAEAYSNRGYTLQELGRRNEALDSYERALAIKPDFINAKHYIFSLHLTECSNRSLIDNLGLEVSALNLRQEIDSFRRKKVISSFRLEHDLEYTTHLLALGYASEALRNANSRLQDVYLRRVGNAAYFESNDAIALFDKEVADIIRFRQESPRYQVAQAIEHCLNPENDWRAIEEQYFSSVPEMIYIDNFLSQLALEELRKFCLISTIWKREYRNQYLGAFPKDGFVSPLHVQIATELRQRMPRIFGDHSLEQLWGFKYSQKITSGINVHADFARVNLNFWITPDEANLDPLSGGLVVYDVPSPPSWSFQEYNQDENQIYDFLAKNRAVSTKVHYKCNRAVLFNSNLFHETDEIHFRKGYENRRINITYLFGKGLKMY
jgi:tetratricopeptide (TPR) repeat protein